MKLARLIIRSLCHPLVFTLGFREGWSDMGMTYDDDAYSPRSEAYDFGRNLRRRGA